MSELKAGDAIDFTVGDKTLRIEPVPYGNIKKVVRIAFDASKNIASGELKSLPDLIDQNLFQMLPLLFAPGRYDFLTSEWIENTMTVPTLRKMLEAAIVVNGLQDFFEKATGKTIGKASPSITATQPVKDGSTTSVDLPTDGVPKM